MSEELTRTKIMVVDDEPVIRRTIRKGLVMSGYDCVEVGESETVMDMIKANKPKLIILDIMMPGKSGRELLPEIVGSFPEIAVIMSTAVVDPKTIVECMKMGANDYITKPFDVEEIVFSVEKVLQMKELENKINSYRTQLEQTVESQKKDIRNLFLNSMETLVFALEAKDKYTAGHSRRVTQIAVAIGEEIGLTPDAMDDLHWGALLHDVGKIAIDPAVQNKKGTLTNEEYRYMMTHASVGGGIIKPLATKGMLDIVIHHHDHFDGKGIEQAVKGQDIPLGARIVAIADSFDAITSDRPYRVALTLEKGINEIIRCSGTQFDPMVLTAFLQTVAAKKIPLPVNTANCPVEEECVQSRGTAQNK